MHNELNKPIFVVGSPRSGTSILIWCLGQHPNLFPVPESNWMGDFAVNVAVAYQIGAARDDYSIFSAMDIRDSELFSALGRSINEVILQHRTAVEQKRKSKTDASKVDARWLEATSISAGPKTRWVDGTSEYSRHICGLLKLFPQALFVHLMQRRAGSRPLNGQLRLRSGIQVSGKRRGGVSVLDPNRQRVSDG
jgi:sulfotransferase family protein